MSVNQIVRSDVQAKPPRRRVPSKAVIAANKDGFCSAICYVLGYLNGTGDNGSTQYEEILHGAGHDDIVAFARKNGEMGFTGLGRYLRKKRS